MELNWIEWNGGECPVPDGHDVSVRFKYGDVRRGDLPELWRWELNNNPDDIAAYFDHTAAEQEEPKDSAVEYTHEYNDYGTMKRCTMVTVEADAQGFIIVMDAFGEYVLAQKDRVYPVKSQAEKEREEFKIALCEGSAGFDFGDKLTAKDAGEIYDWLTGSGMAKRLADKADS